MNRQINFVNVMLRLITVAFTVLVFFVAFSNKVSALMDLGSWCQMAVPTLDACPPGMGEKTVSGPYLGNPEQAKIVCDGGINYGCVKDKWTNCSGASPTECATITFCCAASGAGGTTPGKCATAVGNGCGVKDPDANTDYKCMGVAQENQCTNGGGAWIANSPDGTIYPSCGNDGCCKTPKCPAETGAAGATDVKKPPTEYILTNPLGTTSIPTILGKIIKTFLGIVGALALAVFVYGGVMWMTSRGDSGQVKKGQDALKNGAIGLFIIMFSFVITNSFVQFWTQQQKEIASQEGRTFEESSVASAQKAETAASAKAEAEKTAAAQAAAAQAGKEAGVTPPPPDCLKSGLTPAEQEACQNIPAQSTYNTPAPSQGFGGQPKCNPPNPNLSPDSPEYKRELANYQECLGKTSTIGWKQVCGQTVFDTGYGTYNDHACQSPIQCQPSTVLSSDCAAVANIVAGIPGLPPLGCIHLAITGFGHECEKNNLLCCKSK